MQSTLFELENSLMDRFIDFYLDKNDKSVMRWIRYGLSLKKNEPLYSARSDWFKKYMHSTPLSKLRDGNGWGIPDSDDIQTEIREAIYFVFSILGQDINRCNGIALKEADKRYESVPLMFNDIVRLAVHQGHRFTTFSKYKEGIRSAEVSLLYMLYKLGFVKVLSPKGDSLQLKGEPESQKLNEQEQKKKERIPFGDITNFISRRIKKLEGDRVVSVSILLDCLRNARNDESHNAFYTTPDKYWNRLVYMIYDYITIAFFLRRYLRNVENDENNGVEGEDLEAVKRALKIIDDTVKKANKIKVRFQYVHDETNVQKLSIDVDETGTGKNPHDVTQDPSGLLTEDNITYCYYEKELNRNAICRLQSVVVKNGEDKKCGKELVLNTKLLFNGAVIFIKMPTEENDSIKCPTIESVITKSTGLIEDSETRTVIEKLLADSIYDDTLRDKLRVILMLDKGEKNTIVKEFLAKVGNGSENLKSEDFKQFITTKSDEFLARNERQFDEFINSIKINQDELKGVISNAISKIDLRSLWNANAEIKSEIQNLIEALKSWQDQQRKFEKKNAKEAQVQYNCLINKIEQSNQTIEELYEIFKSQSDQLSKLSTDITWIRAWLENADRRRIIKNLLYGGATVLCLLFLLFIIILSISTGPTVNNSNWMSKIAHSWLGNKDVAYERAKFLEDNKKYPEAAEWYMLARERYADILKDNPSDSVRAMRMTEMSMRGKGGILDFDGAEWYAKMAKRYDIEAYLAAFNGNSGKAVTLCNQLSGKPTAYSELAGVLAYLFYPHNKNSWNEKKIYASMAILDSLCVNENIAHQEALFVCSFLSLGVKEDEYSWTSKWSVIPSLMDVIITATKADELYNDIRSQQILYQEYSRLGLTEKSNIYKHKLRKNGHNFMVIEEDEISEFRNDPLSLIYSAYNNTRTGPMNYAETGHLMHLADSVFSRSSFKIQTTWFYEKWMDCAVKAEDLTSVESVLPFITKSLPDSLRQAAAEYVMAIKYRNGYGVEIDTLKSDEFLWNAASKGLVDAKISYYILRDLQGAPEALDSLVEFALTNPSITKTPAACYVLQKLDNMGFNTFLKPYSELYIYMDLDPQIMSRYLRGVSLDDLMKLDRKELEVLRKYLSWAIANTPPLFKNTAYLLSKLSLIDALLNDNQPSCKWYGSLAMEIDPDQCYTSIFESSEIYRKRGNYAAAHINALDFFNTFFFENSAGIGALDESNRDNVIRHFNQLYPDILEKAEKELNYNFTQGIYSFIEVDKKGERLFSSYTSPVKKLHVELPDYEKFTFPVTMKYFD